MRETPFYWSHGDERSDVLFCMHGIGSCADAFLAQRGLADELKLRLIAWDAPGYRYSADPATEPGIDGWADAAANLIRSLGCERAMVLGVSWGGVTATRLAIRNPELVSALILADSSVGSGTNARQADAMRSRASTLTELGAAEFARQRSPLLVAEGAPRRIVEQVERLFADSIRMPSYQWACNSMAETDHRDSLELITAPTLVICGDEDKVTPPKLSAELAQGIVGSTLEHVEGAGHLANQERPDDFNAKVAQFVRSIS
ncbi:MAG: alpha/beta fold hydrolase [Actinomycetota bacterium]|nr:alpha/beta fold hydrolase [Actinomycetota bacterium]